MLRASQTHAIVGGEADTQHPAVVGIGDMRPLCSGTVIAPKLVLTAAHCITQGTSRYVFVGDSVGVARKVRVAGHRVHPQFDSLTLEHDVAVLSSEDDLGVAPMALGKVLPRTGARITIVGFGDTRETDAPRGVRRAGEMVVGARKAWSFEARPSPATACGFDSGGAALLGAKLVGVISGGDILCKQKTVFSRVDVHQRFIAEAMVELSTSEPEARSLRTLGSQDESEGHFTSP